MDASRRRDDPYDPLALSVESRLKATRRSLLDENNIQFFNSLSPLIPHPLRIIELEELLQREGPSSTTIAEST
jgi:hypothetical protein